MQGLGRPENQADPPQERMQEPESVRSGDSKSECRSQDLDSTLTNGQPQCAVEAEQLTITGDDKQETIHLREAILSRLAGGVIDEVSGKDADSLDGVRSFGGSQLEVKLDFELHARSSVSLGDECEKGIENATVAGATNIGNTDQSVYIISETQEGSGLQAKHTGPDLETESETHGLSLHLDDSKHTSTPSLSIGTQDPAAVMNLKVGRPGQDTPTPETQGTDMAQSELALDELQKAKEIALASLGSVDRPSSLDLAAEPDAYGHKVPKRRRSRKKRNSQTQMGGPRHVSHGAYNSHGETTLEASSGTETVTILYVTAPIEVPAEFKEFVDVFANFSSRADSILEERSRGDRSGVTGLPEDHTASSGHDSKKEAVEQTVMSGAAERAKNHVRDAGGAANESEGTEARLDSPSSSHGDYDLSRPVNSSTDGLGERRRRRQQRLTVAELKSLVSRPELVEPWDITAPDPLLLVHLKAVTGSVVVPANWRQKSKYLQSKRGMEKLPFVLPKYIEETGIGSARAAADEVESSKTAKQKGRERIRPKSGKGVEIDYSAMRDAFFKFQSKPRLTAHGDLYYELREREVNHERFRPGNLSSELREALGISKDDPPPWLVAMQRYGPPPSYPNLVIPGLTAPIPPGASFGYHSGGWGKPPVDEFLRPLYGDVFGEGKRYEGGDGRFDLAEEDRNQLWGEVETGTDDEEELIGTGEGIGSPKNDGRSVADAARADKIVVGSVEASDTSGVLSVAGGVATPVGGIELRKGPAAGKLFEVLEERSTSVGSAGILGSSHAYHVPGSNSNVEVADQGVSTADLSLSKKRKVADQAADAADGTTKDGTREKKFKF